MTETKSSLTTSGFGIEELLSAAYKRTKERLLPYILGYLLAFAIGIGYVVAIIIVVLLNVLIAAVVKSSAISITLGIISSIVGIAGLLYIQGWIQLAIAQIIIAPQKMGVTDAFKTVKPFIWNYIKVMIITGLFMMGLAPFGILSLLVIFFLWNIWNIFTIFVFLERRETGLKNLFISREIVNTKFWGVVLRFIVIYAAYFFVMYLLAMAQLHTKSSGLGGFLIFILGIVATPFIISYGYEIYHHIEHPKEAKSNTVWIVLSVIGWIINIALIVFLATSVSQGVNKIMQDKKLQKDFMKQLEGGDKMKKNEFQQVMPKDI